MKTLTLFQSALKILGLLLDLKVINYTKLSELKQQKNPDILRSAKNIFSKLGLAIMLYMLCNSQYTLDD